MHTEIETAHFEHAPEQLFDMLADVCNEPKWQPDVREVTMLTDGPVRLGTRFHGAYRGLGEMDVEITEYDRPRRVAFHCEGSRMNMDVPFTFTPAGGGTDLEGRIDLELKGLARALRPLMGMMMGREMAKRPGQMRAGLQALYGDPGGGAADRPASGDASS